MPELPPRSLLDPRLAARVASLELRARAAAEGAFAGRHRSRRKGRSSEFSGQRPYTPSDDWRRIDWRAFARTDRWVVREDEEETNRRVLLLLDASASMGFQGAGRSPKLQYGAVLAAALAYGLIRRGEAVGAGVFSEDVRGFVPPTTGEKHLPRLLESLAVAAPSGRTRLPEVLDGIALSEKRRLWLIVLSDLWSDGGDVLPSFRRLRARAHEVSVLCPLDPLEVDLPAAGDFLFKDLESGEVLNASAGELRGRYRDLLEARFARLERGLATLQVPLLRCLTDKPEEESLSRFLERVR